MSINDKVLEIAKKAKQSACSLARTSENKRNSILHAIALELQDKSYKIQDINFKDILEAQKNNMSAALVDRLTLDEKIISGMVKSVENIISFNDPLNKVLEEITSLNGLVIKKVVVPIGVIGIIYESRPNVTVDVASLCIKSGNVVILKGGKESLQSNEILVEIIRQAIESQGGDPNWVQFIDIADRLAVNSLLKQQDYVDLIIPRGGEGLIKMVSETSTIPVLKHYKGVCHVFIDKDCDKDMAIDIVLNAKCQRPGVCNAIETLLVHEGIVGNLLSDIINALIEKNVRIKGCKKTRESLSGVAIEKAEEEDWYTEYLDLILSVKVVKCVEEAITHINKYGSKHSDAIVTSIKENAELFLSKVDSACVYHNASTRFTDGGEFGKGAEIGISTDKIHARGPVGLQELTIYKYVIEGTGQIRN